MKSKKHQIIFHGFLINKNASQKKCFLKPLENGKVFELIEDECTIATISCLWIPRKSSEKYVWEYIFSECRKYTQTIPIFIDKKYVDEYNHKNFW